MKVSYRLLIIAALFITCLLTANIVGSKVFTLGSFALPAAVIVFPFSYIFGDILTEVYGYRQARRIIWLGFVCNLIFVFFAWLGGLLPPAAFWEDQAAYETILGYTPRLLGASAAGYLVGSFANAYILARMKVLTKGRWLWSRTIGSTIIGEGFDTAIFITLAFYGTPAFAAGMIFNHWLAKIVIEIAATPLTYKVVNTLKKRDGTDTYDMKTNFNPLSLREKSAPNQ